MRYRESQIDRRNVKWFQSDHTRATLRAIQLRTGHLRGLYPFSVDFEYPISAFAGENGSGKSTLLAMAACAFHNKKRGYKLPERRKTYYTFSDFFIQATGELSPEGVSIGYQIMHNNWRGKQPGPGWQSSKKRIGGKWSNYDRRVDRNVIHFGIERVVPPNERGAYRSYRHRFSPAELDEETKSKICQIAGRIIAKDYDDFSLHQHHKYRLAMVKSGTVQYSGFNMGAGECAVFNMLVALFEAGPGTLLVVDEIELGLHEKAQQRLIRELKTLCNEFHCQVICSTHSPVILENLPPHARFFVETHGGQTNVMRGISPQYACGKLAGRSSGELTIFIEDEIGEAILMDIMPLNIRERIRLFPIGSLDAVLRQIAARYREQREECIAFLDGDKMHEHPSSMKKIKRYLEERYRCTEDEINEWINARLRYLPGNVWPEKWLIEQTIAQNDFSALLNIWQTDYSNLCAILDEALRAGKHNEFFSLSKNLHLSKQRVQSDLIRFVIENVEDEVKEVLTVIEDILQQE
jgi:predicted ATPase